MMEEEAPDLEVESPPDFNCLPAIEVLAPVADKASNASASPIAVANNTGSMPPHLTPMADILRQSMCAASTTTSSMNNRNISVASGEMSDLEISPSGLVASTAATSAVAMTPTTPNKRRLNFYSLSEKLVAVELAEKTSNSHVARIYNVDLKSVREWRKAKDQLREACVKLDDGHRKRQRGGGKKPLSVELERRLLDWVAYQLTVSDPSLITCRVLKLKAMEIFEGLQRDGVVASDDVFKASDGWLEKFMKRNSAPYSKDEVD